MRFDRVNCVDSPCVFQLRVEGRSSGASSSSSVLPPVWDRSCSTAQRIRGSYGNEFQSTYLPYKIDARHVSSAADMHAAAYQS